MSHLREFVRFLTDIPSFEWKIANVLPGVFLLSGILACSSSTKPASPTQHQLSDVASHDVIDWRKADPVRMNALDSSKLKHHRVIDWMAHERSHRSQHDHLAERHQSINWQKLNGPTRNDTRVKDQVEQNGHQPQKGSGLALRTEDGSNSNSKEISPQEDRSRTNETDNPNDSDEKKTHESTGDKNSSRAKLVSTPAHDESSNSSLNGSTPEQATSTDRNRSAPEKQDHTPSGHDSGTRPDRSNTHEQQNSTGHTTSSQPAENVTVKVKRKERDRSDSEVKTIYLDEVNWQKLPDN